MFESVRSNFDSSGKKKFGVKVFTCFYFVTLVIEIEFFLMAVLLIDYPEQFFILNAEQTAR